MIKIKLVFILIYVASAARSESAPRVCEPIKIELCKRIGYNFTSLPNLIGHEYQNDVDLTLQTFSPLISYGCSAQLNFFLCSVYVPMCEPKVNSVIGPCFSLCEAVRARCQPVLVSFGFQWPNSLDCSRFPKDNNHENMCMEGPGEPSPLDPPPKTIQPIQSSCKYLYKSHLYVRLNRNNKCTPLCEADIMFDVKEKQIAWLWIGSLSVAALLISITALLCLILSDVSWDRHFLPLVLAHCLASLSWGIRILAGRNKTSCGYDSQFPGISLLLTDGLSTSPCSSTFLLRYYFGMCGSIWVAIFCYRWNFLVRQHMTELLSGSPSTKSFNHGTFLQICAFGIPALQTIMALVMKLVDADELLGTCYVGNQSDKALLSLVGIPMLIYWTIGCGYLLTGYLTKKSMPNVQLSAYLNSLGTFLLIYNVLTAFILLSIFFIFGNREYWLINSDGINTAQQPMAPLWLYILHSFLELLLGVLTSSWAIGPKLRSGFCRAQVKQPNNLKSQTSISYQHNPCHSASYQTICPPNSIVSTSMVSMTTVPKYSLNFKYPHQPSSRYSPRGRRSRSSYRTASQASHRMNETIL